MSNPANDIGELLLALARDAIGERFGHAARSVESLPRLEEHGATFVTLMHKSRLRGCIGSLEAHRPLHHDVRANAVAAAFSDPRFAPLAEEEFVVCSVEVSLLSAPELMSFTDETDALAQLRPGVDGVILFHGCRRSTFLPQVWEALPEPERFMAQLKQKAGLRPELWDDQIMLARYQVQKWKEGSKENL